MKENFKRKEIRESFKNKIISKFGVIEWSVFTNFSFEDRDKYQSYCSSRREKSMKSPSEWLYNKQNMTFELIGQKLNISPSVVYDTYNKALRKLKIIFKNKNISLKDFEF